MKVISQSVVSSRPGYFHLAYLATTTRMPQGGLFGLGLVMFVVGFVLTYKVTFGKTKRGFTSINVNKRKNPKKKVTRNFIVLILGLGVICLSFYFGRDVYNHADRLARSKLYSLRSFIVPRDIRGEELKPSELTTWCDKLVVNFGMGVGYFQHPSARLNGDYGDSQKICNYALNANLTSLETISDIPGDMVFLFESKPGWNQVGGVELVNTELGKKSGCYIVFGDGRARFVKSDEIAGLRWRVDSD